MTDEPVGKTAETAVEKAENGNRRSAEALAKVGAGLEAARRAAVSLVPTRPIPRSHLEVERERARSDSWLVACMAMAIFGFLGYSAASTVDVAVVAQGKVVGEERVQTVGSFDGGTVANVPVRAYAHVAAGDVLVELDANLAEADRRQYESAAVQARADAARLVAERDGTELLLSGIPSDVAAAAKANLANRRSRMEKESSAKASELSSKERSLSALRRSLAPLEEEIAAHRSLVESGNFARTRLLEELSRQEELLGRIASGEADVRTARSQMDAVAATHSEQISEELAKAQAKLAEAEQILAKARQHEGRTIVRSPVSGRIKTLAVHGAGGAVKPGDTLAEIVRDDAPILIEARMAGSDAGHVHIGQKVIVTLSPPDMAYGEISGEVVSVAPDAHADDKGNLTHFAEIRPERNEFPSARLDSYRLSPGVPVMVSMAYGQKTLFASLFGGLLGEYQMAMKAR